MPEPFLKLMLKFVYSIESIGSYQYHKADIGISIGIQMRDKR